MDGRHAWHQGACSSLATVETGTSSAVARYLASDRQNPHFPHVMWTEAASGMPGKCGTRDDLSSTHCRPVMLNGSSVVTET